MGVPKILRYMNNNFKDCYTTVQVRAYKNNFEKSQKTIPSVDYLLADAQGLAYKGVAEVFRNGDDEYRYNDEDFYKHLSYDEKIQKSYEYTFQALKDIIDTVEVKKVVYVAFDGPVNNLKISQQRQRRFRAVLEKDMNSYSPEIGKFDRNSITPGTEFNFELSKAFDCYLRILTNDEKYKHLKVILAPNSSAGEGEHKIQEYVRKLPESERLTNTFTIVGNDGDLFFLGLTLSTLIHQVYLLYPDHRLPQFNNYNITRMGKIFGERIGFQGSFSTSDFIKATIVVGFFMGNDFLPMVAQYPHDFGDVFPKALELYSDSSNKGLNKNNHIVVNGKLNFNGYFMFVKELQKYEISGLIDMARKYTAVVNNPNANEESKMSVNHNLVSSFKSGTLDMELYRKLYYEKVFGSFTEKDIKKMCHDFVKTHVWNFDYYCTTIPSWDWMYSYYYCPLMTDLVEYLNEFEDFPRSIMSFDLGEPIKPFVQLLTVLPRQSYRLLPDELQQLMTDDASPFIENYPVNFKIDFTQKIVTADNVGHQGIAILPFPDVTKITEIYKSVAEKMPSIEFHERNIFSNNVLYERRANHLKTYVSKYGEIAINHVVSTIIPNESFTV